MTQWVVFWITAALLIGALFCFASAVIGVYRFGFIMNRMHAAGIGDTLGLALVIAGCVISAGISMDTLKLLLLCFFMWFTSPASTHFLGQVEYFTNEHLEEDVELLSGRKEEGESRERD